MESRDQWAALVVAVAQQRDKSAFVRIFDHFTPRLESYLARLGLEEAVAEDIAQEVMVTIWQKAFLFDPEKSTLSTWIYRIARNKRIDHARRGQAQPVDPASPVLLDRPDEGDPDRALDGEKRDDLVRRLIQTLPKEQRDLVRRAFYEGLSHTQIADQTGIALGTVKSRLRLAFARLRKGLEAAGIEETG